ncbi:MAG: hypothetical protein VB036_11625, partial [Propionicimonas sp.]|nr:hypothetical protein [Propionicimonas sp.]
MTTDLLHQASDRLTSEFSPTWLELDQRTGLPSRIGSAQTGEVDLAATFSLVLGGTEHRGMHGELDYDGCSISSDLHRTGRIRDQLCLDGRLYTVPIQAAGWYGTLCYQIGSASPEITWSWRLVPGPNAEVLRDVRIGL